MFILKVYVYHFTYRGEHSITHLKLVPFQNIVNLHIEPHPSSERSFYREPFFRPNTFPPRIEKSDRHYGVANGDDLTYLFPVLQVQCIIIMVHGM